MDEHEIIMIERDDYSESLCTCGGFGAVGNYFFVIDEWERHRDKHVQN